MNNITLVILSAGDSTRFIKESRNTKKQWIWMQNTDSSYDIPLWRYVTTRLKKMYDFDKIIITSSIQELNFMNKFLEDNETIIKGGKTRSHSMQNALKEVDSKYVMITDMARVCVPFDVIDRLINNIDNADCIVPNLSINDTIVYEENNIDRDNVKIIQTPQLSKTQVLIEALKYAISNDIEFTDDSSAIKSNGGTIKYIDGDDKSKKLTHFSDLNYLNQIDCIQSPSPITFCGSGLDIHEYEKGKIAVLGGVEIESEYGFKAHSDGDVLIHSIIDSILGAIGAGDIGEFFPDTDEKYKNIDSTILLEHIVDFISKVGFEIVNIDTSIICEIPKINPHKDKINLSLSTILKIPRYKINIKATTAEKLGFIGRKEGIAVQSIATLKYKNLIKKK